MSGSTGPQPAHKNHPSLANLSDDILLSRVLRREPEALGALYDRFSPVVYTAAMCLTDDTSVADAVVIAVFETIWHTAGSYCHEQTVERWVLCVTRHHIAPYLGRAQGLQQPERRSTAIAQHHTTPGSDGGDSTPASFMEIVRAALTPTERTAIALTYHRRLSPDLLALLLGEPLKRAKSLLREGFFKLHSQVSPGENERTI